jgi:drug/metabolite transporter (DMT)-like permease
MIKLIFIIIISEIFTAAGHILFKKSTNELELKSLRGIGGHASFIKDIIVKPAIWVGLGSMAIGLFVWLAALNEGELSLAFSIGSIQYVITLFAARALLGEKIDRMKLIGTLLVMFGIIIISMT